jgi:membrane protease YdiL (CAAX protease family)
MKKAIFTWVKKDPIPIFFLMTFVLAWAQWLPLGMLAPQQVLLTLPGAWAPTVSAVLLIGFSEGRAGINRFLKQVSHWRVPLRWYLVVLFGIAAIAVFAGSVGTLFGFPAPGLTFPPGLPRDAWLVFLPVLFLVNLFMGGPLAEDIGWRGYILPKLRERMSTLSASLLIGVIWAFWHLPFFIFSDWGRLTGNIPFFWFLLLTTSWSVLFAWVYVNTQSILMPVLFHAAINTTLGTLGILGTGNESLLPLVLNTFLTWVAAGLVVLFFGVNLKRSYTTLLEQQPSGVELQ